MKNLDQFINKKVFVIILLVFSFITCTACSKIDKEEDFSVLNVILNNVPVNLSPVYVKTIKNNEETAAKSYKTFDELMELLHSQDDVKCDNTCDLEINIDSSYDYKYYAVSKNNENGLLKKKILPSLNKKALKIIDEPIILITKEKSNEYYEYGILNIK